MAAWRPGNWLFGFHPRCFVWLPYFERWRFGFSSLWLWFEISYADAAKIAAEDAGSLRTK